MILPKTKRKMGPEHEEKKLLDKEMSVSVEEAVKKAIENPDEVNCKRILKLTLDKFYCLESKQVYWFILGHLRVTQFCDCLIINA